VTEDVEFCKNEHFTGNECNEIFSDHHLPKDENLCVCLSVCLSHCSSNTMQQNRSLTEYSLCSYKISCGIPRFIAVFTSSEFVKQKARAKYRDSCQCIELAVAYSRVY
jgi:hypothetical protein